MPIKVECPDCDRPYRVPDNLAGKKFACKSCGKAIRVPDDDEDPVDVSEDVEDDDDEPRVRRGSKTKKPKRKSGGSKSSMSSGATLGILAGILGVIMLAILIAGIAGLKPSKTNTVASANALELFPVAQVAPPSFPDLGVPRTLPSGARMWFVKMPGSSTPGHAMAMRVYLPPTDAPPQSIPCVLVAPAGTNLLVGNDMDADDYHAETLPYVEAGMAVIFYSLDGGVADMDSASNTDFAAAYKKFRAAHAGVVNGRNALEFVLAKVPQVDPKKIYTAGHSSAGTVSLLMAEHEPRLAGSIAYAPCTDVETRLADASGNWAIRSILPDLVNFLKQSSPKTHVADVRCPIFLFHARDDSNVPVTESQQFSQQLKSAGKQVEFQTVPTGDHYDSMVQQGIPKAITWLKQQTAR